MNGSDPSRGPDGAEFVTSGPRGRKPRIEVLPGPDDPQIGREEGPAAAERAFMFEPPVEAGRADEPRIGRGEGPAHDSPTFVTRGPTSDAAVGRGGAAAVGRGRAAGLLTPRNLLLALLAVGVLAILFGIVAAQRGREEDRAEADAAIAATESLGFPDDTERYYEAESGSEAPPAPAPVARSDPEEAPAAAEAELPPPPVARAEVAAPAAQPGQRPTRVARAEPRPDPRSEPRRAAPVERPEPAGAEAEPSGTQAGALETVLAFYDALGQGDGASAARLVVPGKRTRGPLSAGELTRYFSSFRRPLRVLRATPLDERNVRVAYDYVLPDGRACRGRAVVQVDRSGGRELISRIRTRGPC